MIDQLADSNEPATILFPCAFNTLKILFFWLKVPILQRHVLISTILPKKIMQRIH